MSPSPGLYARDGLSVKKRSNVVRNCGTKNVKSCGGHGKINDRTELNVRKYTPFPNVAFRCHVFCNDNVFDIMFEVEMLKTCIEM